MCGASHCFLEKNGEASINPVFPERHWNNDWKMSVFPDRETCSEVQVLLKQL